MEDAGLVDAINTLLGFLPESWKPHAEAVLALMSVLSLANAAWRPTFAWIAPRAAGSAVYVWFDRTLDWLCANSRRIEVRRSVVKARMSSTPPPPKRKSVPPLLTLALLAGCAGSIEQRTRGQLDAAMTVADLSHEVASNACDQVKDAERCEQIDIAFERIADIGEAALHALDNGAVDKAQDMYEQIGALLRGLKR